MARLELPTGGIHEGKYARVVAETQAQLLAFAPETPHVLGFVRGSSERWYWNGVAWSRAGFVYVGPIAGAPAASGYPAGAMVYEPPIYKATQDNALPWALRTSAADNGWCSVCWSPELRLFVAVAYSGTGNRVMTSNDGITWTCATSAADNGWHSICWSPELCLFVAVAVTGTGNRVMTSNDGITWTLRTSAADYGWYSVCWSPELRLFVAVAVTGTGNRVMTNGFKKWSVL